MQQKFHKLEYLAVYGRASMAAFRQLSTHGQKFDPESLYEPMQFETLHPYIYIVSRIIKSTDPAVLTKLQFETTYLPKLTQANQQSAILNLSKLYDEYNGYPSYSESNSPVSI